MGIYLIRGSSADEQRQIDYTNTMADLFDPPPRRYHTLPGPTETSLGLLNYSLEVHYCLTKKDISNMGNKDHLWVVDSILTLCMQIWYIPQLVTRKLIVKRRKATLPELFSRGFRELYLSSP